MVWIKLWEGTDEVFIEIVNREKKRERRWSKSTVPFLFGPSFASFYVEATEDKKATEG
jgi:hypothetical protein